MMKRILLIVALGVSFVAPAAFADTGLLGYYTCPTTVGINSECQLSAAIGNGATVCDKQRNLDEWQAENIADGYTASGAIVK
jgi:hypothetical protein